MRSGYLTPRAGGYFNCRLRWFERPDGTIKVCGPGPGPGNPDLEFRSWAEVGRVLVPWPNSVQVDEDE